MCFAVGRATNRERDCLGSQEEKNGIHWPRCSGSDRGNLGIIVAEEDSKLWERQLDVIRNRDIACRNDQAR